MLPFPTLRVTWRSQTISLPLTPDLTVSALKSHLHVKTNVPPPRQKLLFPGAKTTSDDQTVVSLFRSGLPRPILLIGTPVFQQQLPGDSVDSVVDDLHELTAPPEPLTPPPVPHFLPPRSPTRVPSISLPPHSVPPAEDHTATNGATLSLEAFDSLLAPALIGPTFVAAHALNLENAPQWVHQMSTGVLRAVSASRRAQRMLAVMLFDFERGSGSTELLRTVTQDEGVRTILDDHFEVLAADVGGMEGGGERLLRRLGMHAVPAVIVIADMGAGVAIVDMFNAEFFDGASGIRHRLEETVVAFDGFYETARVRGALVDDRERILREQDEALAEARRVDREREEREREEELRREEEKRVWELEQASKEAETEEAGKLLPKEPEKGGTRVVLRMPDGRRVERGFEETAKIGDIFNFVVAQGMKRGTFELRSMFPRRVLTAKHAEESLKDAGFIPSVILNVEC